MLKYLIYPIIFIIGSVALFAGGFQINDHSARSVGMAFSTVANINDPSANVYNPAALVNAESDLCISAGASYIMPGGKYTGITTLNRQNTVELEKWNFVIPHFYVSWKTPLKNLTFGAGVYVPFGLGTRWDEDWVGRHLAVETYLQTVEINPNLAYKFNVGNIPVAVSAGVGFAMGKVEMKKNLDNFNPEPVVKLDGTGNATTFNFGLLVEPVEDLKIGFSYRHNIEIEYEGDVNYENISGAETLFQTGTGKTKINFPKDIRFGIAYQFTKELNVEAGINFMGWSSYDTLAIEFEKAPGNPSKSYTSKSARNYKDVVAYRVGAEYILNEKIALRCGIAYDPLAVNSEYIEPVLPEGNRLNIGLGFGYQLCKNFSVDAAYLGVNGMQAETKGNPSQFDGLYNSWANIVSISINYKF